MALNLLKRGFPLTVHSRSQGPVDALVEAGASAAVSPAAVASSSDVIITMVPDSPDVRLVLEGPGVIDEIRKLVGRPKAALAGLFANSALPLVFTLAAAAVLHVWTDHDEVQNLLVGLTIVGAMPKKRLEAEIEPAIA